MVSIDAGMLRYSGERSRQFFDQALERVRAIPGVESAALATRVPFSVNFNRWDIWVPGRHAAGQPGDTVEVTTVSPDYFKTIGVPILQGRGFTDDDRPGTPYVAIVNETMARRYWPGESAVGKTIRVRGSDGPVFQIVGVSGDHKVLDGRRAADAVPAWSRARSGPARIRASSRAPAATRGRCCATCARRCSGSSRTSSSSRTRRWKAEVAATLFPDARGRVDGEPASGCVAMLLAAIGLYGVIAYSVSRRTREIGIRIALGARPSLVLGQVMRQGLVVAAVGLAVGCLLAAAAARAIAGALYGVGVADPVSWSAAAVVLLGVSALANLIPARRAARVDPSIAPSDRVGPAVSRNIAARFSVYTLQARVSPERCPWIRSCTICASACGSSGRTRRSPSRPR